MIQVETSVTIRRPIEDVFDYVSHIENCTEWVPLVVDARQVSPGPLGEGTVVMEVLNMPFRRVELEWRVTAYDPPRLCRFESSSSISDTASTFNLTPVDGGTQLNYQVESEPKGMFKLIDPLLNRISQSQRKQLIAKIKANLENQKG